MFIFIAILLITVGLIAFLISLYGLYCIISIKSFSGKVKKDVKKGNGLNIALALIKKSINKKGNTSSNIKDIVKKKAKVINTILITISFSCLQVSFFCITSGIIVYTLEQQLTTVTTILQSFLFKDEDCLCYAKCTGNKEDDEKCVYELLFGSTEYAILIKDMESTLTSSDKELFEEINKGKDGKAKSEFIRDRINEEMVNDYKDIVGSNSNFRKDDKKDRSKMTYDELKKDLYNLLSDYKINGRNPNCNCETYSNSQLRYKCIGMNHHKEGWSWEALWEDNTIKPSNNTTTTESSTNTPGNATGTYAIELNDGSYYWYHQNSEQCNYNAYNEQYGYVGSCYAGSPTIGTMAARGCGIYSTAIALSNLLGEEITPWKVIMDLLKCNIQQAGSGRMWFQTQASSGLSYSSSQNIYMYKSSLANTINEVYGSKGIVAMAVPFEESTVESYLFSDDVYAYCINSYRTTTNFNWYVGDGHFMVLRPGSEKGKYKCFTSSSTKLGRTHEAIFNTMDEEIPWSLVKQAGKHADCLMITRAKNLYTTESTESTQNNGEVGYNKEVYEALINSKFSSKALALASVYALLEPDYGRDFAIGMMANIYAEGNFGLIEGINFKSAFDKGSISSSRKAVLSCGCSKNGTVTIDYWAKAPCSAHEIAGKIINSESMVDSLLAIPQGVEGIGVGAAQWSGSRRIGILNTYKESCKTYSQDELAIAETLFMKKELQPDYLNGYYYSLVLVPCQGKSATECAKIICTKYEAPASGAANTRAAYAAELVNLLSSVNTSGITSNNTNNSNNTQECTGEAVVEYALQFVGNHYKYGGTKLTVSGWQGNSEHLKYVGVSEEEKKKCPLDGVDCSGFVMKVYEHFGKSLPHSSSSLASVGTNVSNPSSSNMKPGDIVCYSGHVAIYIGNEKIVHASCHEEGIKITNKWNYDKVIVVRRVIN